MFRTVIMAGFFMLLTGCVGTQSQSEQLASGLSLVEQAATLKTEQACSVHGGVWRKVGKLQRFACILPAPDAGKTCTDGSQCEVACVLPSLRPQPGIEVVGQCQATTHRFGCCAYVENGKAGPALCID